MKNVSSHRRRVRHCAQGVALIEFAIVLPFLLALLFGGLELNRYILSTLRLNKAGYLIADILSQSDQAKFSWVSCTLTKTGISETDVRTAMNQLDRLMGSYANSAAESAMVTSLSRVGANSVIQWQVAGGGSLTAGVTSIVTQTGPNNTCCGGNAANAVGDFQTQLASLPDGQNMIVSEVFYRYTPILYSLLQPMGINIPPRIVTRQVMIRTRHGALDAIHDAYPPSIPPLPNGC